MVCLAYDLISVRNQFYSTLLSANFTGFFDVHSSDFMNGDAKIVILNNKIISSLKTLKDVARLPPPPLIECFKAFDGIFAVVFHLDLLFRRFQKSQNT